MRAFIPSGLLIVLFCQSYAQEQLGLRTELRSGMYGVFLNPSSSSYTPHCWEVGIIGVGLFLDNNYGYVRNTSLFHLLRNAENVVDENENTDLNNPDLLYANYYDTQSKTFGALNAIIHGPSVMVTVKGLRLGVFANGRTSISSRAVPTELSYFNYQEAPYYEPFDIGTFRGSGAVWSEFGLTISKMKETDIGAFSIGASFKYNVAYEGGYFDASSGTEITKFGADTVSISNTSSVLAFTNSNDSREDFSLQKNGSGFSFDLGFTVSDGNSDTYIWRFGASIIDVGFLSFNSNSETHTYISNPDFIVTRTDIENEDDLSSVAANISQRVYGGDSSASLSADNFSIGLPTALSLQFDYRLMEDIYINSVLMKRVALTKRTLKRDEFIAVTPRYERDFFSIALPITMYQFTKLHYGLSVRLGYLTIGSDSIAGLMTRSQWHGADIYVGLKINGFGSAKEKANYKNANVKCYNF